MYSFAFPFSILVCLIGGCLLSTSVKFHLLWVGILRFMSLIILLALLKFAIIVLAILLSPSSSFLCCLLCFSNQSVDVSPPISSTLSFHLEPCPALIFFYEPDSYSCGFRAGHLSRHCFSLFQCIPGFIRHLLSFYSTAPSQTYDNTGLGMGCPSHPYLNQGAFHKIWHKFAYYFHLIRNPSRCRPSQSRIQIWPRANTCQVGKVRKREVSLCILPKREISLCILPKRENSLCILPKREISLCILPKREISLCILPKREISLCIFPKREILR